VGDVVVPDGDRVWREIALGANLEVPTATVLDAASVHEIARAQGNVLGSFTIEHLGRLAAVMTNNVRLLQRVQLEVLAADITLFTAARATPGLDRRHADPNAWRTFLSGGIDIVAVDAEHHQMLSPGAVRTIGAVL
jgi:thioesterase domain-containing protein